MPFGRGGETETETEGGGGGGREGRERERSLVQPFSEWLIYFVVKMSCLLCRMY